jgi:hypothetical protein
MFGRGGCFNASKKLRQPQWRNTGLRSWQLSLNGGDQIGMTLLVIRNALQYLRRICGQCRLQTPCKGIHRRLFPAGQIRQHIRQILMVLYG